VKDKTLARSYFGVNLRSSLASLIRLAEIFLNIPMTPDSPMRRHGGIARYFSFLPRIRQTVWLNFKGINYRANIWLNGKQIATSNDVAGAWRTYEFNVTDAVKLGAENAVAVQAFSPTESDLAITFVDWNPAPPDKNMGFVA